MVALYVHGTAAGDLAALPDLLAKRVEVEFRDDTGRRLGTFTPATEPICPWEPTLTKEELDRRAAGPGGSSLADIFKRLGAE